MWYIHEEDGLYFETKTKPNEPFATAERMPAQPVVEGYDAVLKADFQHNHVWWELVKRPDYVPEVENDIWAEIATAIGKGVNEV